MTKELSELRASIDINERGVAWREAVGGALHDAAHPNHPWSGCADPDQVYDSWMPRFLLSLRTDGFDVAALASAESSQMRDSGQPEPELVYDDTAEEGK